MPALPARTAVYRLFDADGALLYVGMSRDPERRFKDHRREKDWWEEVDGISIEWFASRYKASLAEAHAIGTEGPLYNVHQTQTWREQQRIDALAVSPEAGRNRSIGRKAHTAQARRFAALRELGVPHEEAMAQARLAREKYLAAHRPQ